jgi:hypothetical protein
MPSCLPHMDTYGRSDIPTYSLWKLWRLRTGWQSWHSSKTSWSNGWPCSVHGCTLSHFLRCPSKWAKIRIIFFTLFSDHVLLANLLATWHRGRTLDVETHENTFMASKQGPFSPRTTSRSSCQGKPRGFNRHKGHLRASYRCVHLRRYNLSSTFFKVGPEAGFWC